MDDRAQPSTGPRRLYGALEVLCSETLAGWRANPRLVRKDAREEENLLSTGYFDRQIFELVQNAADAARGRMRARIELRLTGAHLYAANTGSPLNEAGLEALIVAGVSPKGGEEIGRFGLGFRSLLRLGGHVDFFSGGFGCRFDPPWCRSQAREAANLADDAEAPGMRLARALHAASEAGGDEILAGMLGWADTVIRAELADPSAHSAMDKELASFPGEFLLFPTPDIRLDIIRPNAERRELARSRRGRDVSIKDGEARQPWRVFRGIARIEDEAARRDAGRLQARDQVPITWAVPAAGSDPRGGQLWNAFPTKTPSPLPGILDTRWKLNSDRTALTGDAWNPALMEAAARIICEALPELATEDDPGKPIGALPRQIAKGEPAAPLHDAVWRTLPNIEFVARADGALARAASLRRPPTDDPRLQQDWSAVAPPAALAGVVHWSCLATRDRASRMEELARRVAGQGDGDDDEHVSPPLDAPGNLTQMQVDDWLLAAAKPDVQVGRTLVFLARVVSQKVRGLEYRLRRAAIIPTQCGRVCAADQAVFPGVADGMPGRFVVHAELAADEEACEILTSLFRVQAMDAAAWTSALDAAWPAWGEPPSCDDGWALLGIVPSDVRGRFLADAGDRLRILTVSGKWRPRAEVLLEGCVVTAADAPKHADILVDAAFARRHGEALSAIGVADTPADRWVVNLDRPSRQEAEQQAVEGYKQRVKLRASPQAGTLGYVSDPALPVGLPLLKHLQEPCRARLTGLLLSRLQARAPAPTLVGGRGSPATRERYPPAEAPHPAAWLLWKYGTVRVGARYVLLAACSELRRRLDAAGLGAIEEILPDDAPLRRHWAAGWGEFTSKPEPVWLALFALRQTRDPLDLRPVWEAAARQGVVPKEVPDPWGVGDVPLGAVCVAIRRPDFDLALLARRACALLASDVAARWIEGGAVDVARLIEIRQVGEASEAVRAIDEVTGLADFLEGQSPWLRFVERLERVLDKAAAPGDLVTSGAEIVVSKEWWRSAGQRPRLERLLRAVADLAGLTRPFAEVLSALDQTELDERRRRIAELPDLPSRLLAAAGGRAPIEARLPDAARRVVLPEVADLMVATLFLDVFGPGALRELRDQLDSAGLRPPTQWWGDEARQFVLALGFPSAFAGSANPRPQAEILVQGPRPLPPLHDYQQAALAELRAMLQDERPRRRGVLSLPTGAGKTRVAVEAAVRVALRGSIGAPVVLWVAQTEELAEQAVEAFRHVWSVEGVEAQDLRVVRFWGGQRTPPPSDLDLPTVVVALINTLDARMRQEEAAWIATAALVIIDESHHAIASSYTELLGRLGVATGAMQAARTVGATREPALLGLSATPFRSSGDDESWRLASRFSGRVVPADQHGLYEKLRGEGILARVHMDPLELDQPFELTSDEAEHVARFTELPESALQRLSMSEPRNRAILETIEQAPERSILLFANGVDHAVELAARLSLRGVRARAVSGATDRSARVDAVAAFKKGEVRVICNAAVFATGFDAPSVEMVLIGRPVFSPVRFMQMVGRGLRGVRNGGTERCRVVTVRDNIVGYEGRDPLSWWRRYYE